MIIMYKSFLVLEEIDDKEFYYFLGIESELNEKTARDVLKQTNLPTKYKAIGWILYTPMNAKFFNSFQNNQLFKMHKQIIDKIVMKFDN